ncbi:hypothetical protein, partial [Streptomyces sp. IBSBF 2806]|uniref:hypothetical protein n=1 Tax=Streptomyces sp. IBSBF 2806 TaxID=2903529 RepID=UPI002FDBE53F
MGEHGLDGACTVGDGAALFAARCSPRSSDGGRALAHGLTARAGPRPAGPAHADVRAVVLTH